MRPLALLAVTMLAVLPSSGSVIYKTSSLGNSHVSPASSVPSNVKAMAVNRSGFVAVQTDWEEGGKEASILYGGHVLRTPAGHGWGAGYRTGIGAAINSELAFFAQSQGNDDHTLAIVRPDKKWPAFEPATKTNYHDWGVYVLRLDGTPLGGGEGLEGAFFPLNRAAESIGGVKTGIDARIESLAADETHLWVATQGQIRKYAIDSIRAFAVTNEIPAPVRSWPAKGVTGMAVDREGVGLWVVQNGVVNKYAEGVLTETITDVRQPIAISTGVDGRLFVATGTQVFDVYPGPPSRIFSVTGTSLFSGPVPGAAGGARFAGIVGVGSDRSGRLYVAENRSRLDTRVSQFRKGIELWSVQSIGSINIAEPDPSDGTSWYSVTNRMTFDAASGGSHAQSGKISARSSCRSNAGLRPAIHGLAVASDLVYDRLLCKASLDPSVQSFDRWGSRDPLLRHRSNGLRQQRSGGEAGQPETRGAIHLEGSGRRRRLRFR
jgi:hypothetical protein